MKILLDESIDVRLKAFFPTSLHEVYTVRDMKWNGIKNGVLLNLLEVHHFDCWIVVDKNIPHQQNINKLPCTILVLDVFRNTLASIKPLLPELLARLEKPFKSKVIYVPDINKS